MDEFNAEEMFDVLIGYIRARAEARKADAEIEMYAEWIDAATKLDIRMPDRLDVLDAVEQHEAAHRNWNEAARTMQRSLPEEARDPTVTSNLDKREGELNVERELVQAMTREPNERGDNDG